MLILQYGQFPCIYTYSNRVAYLTLCVLNTLRPVGRLDLYPSSRRLLVLSQDLSKALHVCRYGSDIDTLIEGQSVVWANVLCYAYFQMSGPSRSSDQLTAESNHTLSPLSTWERHLQSFLTSFAAASGLGFARPAEL